MNPRDQAARRSSRQSWPVRKYRLGQEPGDDLTAITTAEQRFAMMWPLAVEAWRLAGREIPDYDRAHTPIRVIRPGHPDRHNGLS